MRLEIYRKEVKKQYVEYIIQKKLGIAKSEQKRQNHDIGKVEKSQKSRLKILNNRKFYD